ncbi:MAG: hypothetical protein R3F11_31925, partial [Verrucomicrobiales bacterium]
MKTDLGTGMFSPVNQTYHYDALGNRTSVVSGGATTAYGAANAPNQSPSVGVTAFAYDARGN